MPKRDALSGNLGCVCGTLLLIASGTGCDAQVVLAQRNGVPVTSRGESSDVSPDAAPGVGSLPVDAGDAGADAPGRPVFGAPRLIEELSLPDAKDQDPTLTADLLEIFFFSDRGGEEDLWTSRRVALGEPWQPPTLVAELSSTELDINPAVSGDGLELWFHSRREPSGIYHTIRATREDPWDTPQHVAAFGGHIAPAPSADLLRMGLSVLMGDDEHREIVESIRASVDAEWAPFQAIAGLNVEADDSTPFLFGEGLVLFFSSARSGAGDLYWTSRPDFESPVATPQPLTELNDAQALDTHPHVAADGKRIYFGSLRSGMADLYEAELADSP